MKTFLTALLFFIFIYNPTDGCAQQIVLNYKNSEEDSNLTISKIIGAKGNDLTQDPGVFKAIGMVNNNSFPILIGNYEIKETSVEIMNIANADIEGVVVEIYDDCYEGPAKKASPKTPKFNLVDLFSTDDIDKAKKLRIKANNGSEDAFVLCFQDSTGVEPESVTQAEVQDVCENPSFYRTGEFPLHGKIEVDKPFYVIEHDFDNLNTGPKVILYKKAGSEFEFSEKNTLVVGREVTFVYKNFKPDFEKILHEITFKDYNQEDAATFKGFINLGKEAVPGDDAKKDSTEPNGEKGAGLTEQKVYPNLNTALDALISDLTSLAQDAQKATISTKKFDSYFSLVKARIGTCFGIVGKVDTATLNSNVELRTDDPKLLQKVNQASQLLVIIGSYAYFKPPTVQVKNADELISDVNYIVDNENQIYTNELPHQFAIRGGLKLDFSTGLFFSDIVNDKYLIINSEPFIETQNLEDGTTRTDTVQMKSIISENVNDFQLGFGVLSHFYPRLTKWFSISLTTGFIVKENLAVQFPAGISFLMGRESRLVLSAGRTFGEKHVLSAKYQLNVPVEASSLDNVNEAQLTTDKFSKGWFFSLTYNFAGANIGGR